MPNQDESRPTDTEAELEGPEVLGTQVCNTCIGDNLLKECGIRKCARCLNPFCIHYASKADPLTFCVGCMSAIELTRSVVTKTYEHYDEQTDVTRTYTRKAREIRLAGEDWMFAQRRVKDLSEAELDMMIEYHRQYLMLLCTDQEKRRAERMHRYAGVKNPIIGLPAATTTTTTTVKKTSTIKLDRQKEQAAVLLAQLMNNGMDLTALMEKIKK